MSLLKPCILVIPIVLTNGDEVIFEINHKIFSKTYLIDNPDDKIEGIISLQDVKNQQSFSIAINQDGDVIKKNQKLPENFKWDRLEEFSNSLNPFDIDGMNGFEIIYDDRSGLTIGHFHVDVPELKKIFIENSERNFLSLHNGSLLYVNTDGCDLGKRELNKPIKMTIEKKYRF